ncbi:MAG: hypothetical protein EZS28_009813 [Streblomastix strix]|uniref:Uncharacterized protein n=1 Tax=Streblomastix strix TaxID=222440 RepID=A0A5J4WIG0_9EUKA|nr:MAG: hypothetical protein EZS28_009813 [Streblomastix strix]
MLADIEEHPHVSKVQIPNITAVPEQRVVAAAPNNQGKQQGLTCGQLLLSVMSIRQFGGKLYGGSSKSRIFKPEGYACAFALRNQFENE